VVTDGEGDNVKLLKLVVGDGKEEPVGAMVGVFVMLNVRVEVRVGDGDKEGVRVRF
jgi:hypothetical protein